MDEQARDQLAALMAENENSINEIILVPRIAGRPIRLAVRIGCKELSRKQPGMANTSGVDEPQRLTREKNLTSAIFGSPITNPAGLRTYLPR